jgi:hypothetical protein
VLGSNLNSGLDVIGRCQGFSVCSVEHEEPFATTRSAVIWRRAAVRRSTAFSEAVMEGRMGGLLAPWEYEVSEAPPVIRTTGWPSFSE